jgi:hypothetical protein
VLTEAGLSDARAAIVPPFEGELVSLKKAPLEGLDQPIQLLAVLGTDADGTLQGSAEKTLGIAHSLAGTIPFGVLLLTPTEEKLQRLAVSRLLQRFSGPVVLLPVREVNEKIRCKVLAEYWPGLEGSFQAVVGEPWCESAFESLALQSSQRDHLALRVRRLVRDQGGLIVETTRAGGRVAVQRPWKLEGGRTSWLTLARDAIVESGPLPRGNTIVRRWQLPLQTFYSRQDIRLLLDELKTHTGLVRLSDADFIIDVGFGVGNRDGYEAVIEPLERTLRELGVRNVVVGGSRKVTEELHRSRGPADDAEPASKPAASLPRGGRPV